MSGGAISVADWDRVEVPPGYKAEIIGGELVVTPSGTPIHGLVRARLAAFFDRASPSNVVAIGNVEWHLPRDGMLACAPRPDVMVIRHEDIHAGRWTAIPLLVAEVLSPSDYRPLERTPRSRIAVRREDYARNGLAHYLEVTPANDNGNVVVARYELHENTSVPVTIACGSALLIAEEPFHYTLRPADLVGL